MNKLWKRTHTCGDLRHDDVGKSVILHGWVEAVRDHGGVFFVDLRDRYGVTQIVFRPQDSQELHAKSATLRSQDVVGIKGKVLERPQGTINKQRATGAIEIAASELVIHNRTKTTPFVLEDDTTTDINVRLKYRYLDLRRAAMQKNLMFRSHFNQVVRSHLAAAGFLELETPILTKATPEGARDYLVPSRVNPGLFYALPQSPQLFKQLFMVAGYDKYFQIARCFRDEDLRADRQPEFTQIDIEMSFVVEEDVQNAIEQLVAKIFRECKGIELRLPLPRLSYAESVRRFGLDKPDLRFGCELHDITELVANSDFRVFRDVIQAGGIVKTMGIATGGKFTRKDFDGFSDFVKDYGAKGVAYLRLEGDKASGPVAKFIEPFLPELKKLAPEADLFLFLADQAHIVNNALGYLRLAIGEKLGLRNPQHFELCWVTDFPMFEKDATSGAWLAMHHPFTAVNDWTLLKSGADLQNIYARAYDLVLNGTELGSGSIRIHNRENQEKIFDLLGIAPQEAQDRFGFFLEAVEFGAPPHGGFAIGVDRLIQLLLGEDGIREVIAFPKTATAACLMTGAPSTVAPEQLAELRIRTIVSTKEAK